MDNLDKLLASYQMVLHEAVDAFEDEEYQELANLLPAALMEYADLNSQIENLQVESERLKALVDDAETVIRPLVRLCPWSADMRVLYMAAFSEYTDAYDGLDDAIVDATDWLDRVGDNP